MHIPTSHGSLEQAIRRMGYRLLLVSVFLASLVVAWKQGGHLHATSRDNPADAIDAALASGNPKRQKDALQRLGTDSALAARHVAEVAKLLSHGDPEIRVAAARAVVAAGEQGKRYLPQLLKLMTDTATTGPRGDTIPVWYQVSEAVGSLGKPVVSKLIPWLSAETPLKCRAASIALHEAGSSAREAVPAIARLLKTGDMEYTLELLHALIGIGPAGADALPAVIPVLDHENFHAQYWACKAIGAMGPAAKEAVPALVRKMKKSAPSVRRHAALALGKIGAGVGKEGIAALIRCLDDPVHPVREDCLTALAQIGPAAKEAAPVLQQKLVEKKITPIAHALYAYYRISGDREFVEPRFLARLGSLNARVETLPLLAQMGPEARFALDHVIVCAGSRDEVVRLLAIETLERIGVYNDRVLAIARAFASDDEPDPDVRRIAQRILAKAKKPR